MNGRKQDVLPLDQNCSKELDLNYPKMPSVFAKGRCSEVSLNGLLSYLETLRRTVLSVINRPNSQ